MRWLRLLAFFVLASCAYPDVLSGGVLRKGDLRVHIGTVPSGWRRISVEGADLAYRDDVRDGSILFDVRCGHRDDDAPLSVLTEHLVFGTTERLFDAQDVVPFDGREAMHSKLHAKLDGVVMQYDIYVMKKDGCLFDLVYIASPEHFAGGASEFETFAEGVHAQSSSVATGGGPLSPGQP